MNTFFDNPDQWELFKRDGTGGHRDRWRHDPKGQRAGLFYSSANIGEAVFARPFDFNVL